MHHIIKSVLNVMSAAFEDQCFGVLFDLQEIQEILLLYFLKFGLVFKEMLVTFIVK